jgi:hypothetical protein
MTATPQNTYFFRRTVPLVPRTRGIEARTVRDKFDLPHAKTYFQRVLKPTRFSLYFSLCATRTRFVPFSVLVGDAHDSSIFGEAPWLRTFAGELFESDKCKKK